MLVNASVCVFPCVYAFLSIVNHAWWTISRTACMRRRWIESRFLWYYGHHDHHFSAAAAGACASDVQTRYGTVPTPSQKQYGGRFGLYRFWDQTRLHKGSFNAHHKIEERQQQRHADSLISTASADAVVLCFWQKHDFYGTNLWLDWTILCMH